MTNQGAETHEFVVLRTDSPADSFPIVSFEGEPNRIDEDAKGVTNVGETGDMEPGATMALSLDLAPGHYAVVCNLAGHYAMGMHQDFNVVPAGSTPIQVGLGETDPTHMFIDLSQAYAPEGRSRSSSPTRGRRITSSWSLPPTPRPRTSRSPGSRASPTGSTRTPRA